MTENGGGVNEYDRYTYIVLFDGMLKLAAQEQSADCPKTSMLIPYMPKARRTSLVRVLIMVPRNRFRIECVGQ